MKVDVRSFQTMLAHETLANLRQQLDFMPVGEPAGNLTIGRGRLRGGPLHVAIVENRIASGALGAKESNKLASLFKVVTATKSPLVIYLDSAGAKISEGLPALGAFRHMYHAALAMADSGAPTAVFCGANCYGGASMLASLAGVRYYSSNTRLAMSGPAILAQTAGVSVLDEMFQAMSLQSIGAEARTRLSLGNLAASPAAMIDSLPTATLAAARHTELGARLTPSGKPAGAADKVERKELDRLYPQGHSLRERDGVLVGEATVDGAQIAILGLLDGKLLGAARAWRLADRVWQFCGGAPKVLHLLVDCESHATTLDDERIMLSAYLADLACALHALSRAGTRIETTVLGKLGGGVYVAVCAPVAQVNLLHGAEIQLLPGKAIASILGEAGSQKFDFQEYRSAGVAEQEIRLGLV